MKKLFSVIASIAISPVLYAQCNTTTINGDLIISSDIFMSGIYNVSGNFIINSGVTVYVEPYSFSSCGKLEIHASKISINGVINGEASGYMGGTGGNSGNLITSLTGDIASLVNCSNEDNSGHVTLEGGLGGMNGNGPGGGIGGADGNDGSGPKQTCQTWDDEAGMIGGSGGAGGGGGASYGGIGSAGSAGGDGSDFYLTSGINISTAYVVLKGNGGNGGNPGVLYGTSSSNDFDAGSGGAGGGGGGRSYYVGSQGGNGGNGGAGIYLHASDSIFVTGLINTDGGNGLNGGNGGDGGVSEKCCSDGCDDCGEATVSAGAGAGSGGGGGSGGAIFIESNVYVEMNGTLSSNGGNGGIGGVNGVGAICDYGGGGFCSGNSVESGDGEDGSNGGAGGGGRIKIKVPECANSLIGTNVSVNAGTGNGTAAVGTFEIICSAVGIEEVKKLNANVYPNPVNDELFIEIVNANSEVIIEIISVSGQVLFFENMDPSSIIRLDFSSFPSGFYLCKIKSGKSEINKKIIH